MCALFEQSADRQTLDWKATAIYVENGKKQQKAETGNNKLHVLQFQSREKWCKDCSYTRGSTPSLVGWIVKMY